MPTFDTHEPIFVTVELGVGHIQIEASDRADTVVEVAPSDGSDPSDVAAAEQAHVEYAGGRLVIRAPRGWRRWTPRGGGESIDVHIQLPAGSHVQVTAGIAALRCSGHLGECRYKTGIGDIRVEQAGPMELKTGKSDVDVGKVVGHAEVATGSGSARIASIEGTAAIKNSNGDIWIGEVTGDLRAVAANGKIVVDRAHAAVTAKTANGGIRLGEVARGAVLAETAWGQVEVCILDGVAAWLDLNTGFGNVENELVADERPESGEETVEVRARTAFGDIIIRRCRGGRRVASDEGSDHAGRDVA